MDLTSSAALTAILGAAATSLSSVSPGSVAVPGADQLDATAQLLGRINALAVAASTVQVRSAADVYLTTGAQQHDDFMYANSRTLELPGT